MRLTERDGGRVIHIAGHPNERQAEFFASRAKVTAYGGARGGGKSWALRRKSVGLCLTYPGIRCLLLRRSLAELRANHVLPMLREYGAILRYAAGEAAFLFPNGSRIECGYCDSERDVLRYQGQEYDIIAIDEATQLSELQFMQLRACVRGVGDMPRRMYLTCNPGGVGHAWVKRLFIDRCYRAGERAEDYAFIPARVWDNVVLTEQDPDYVHTLEALPERLRAAWLDGRWDVFEGQFFAEFDETRHVIPPSDALGGGRLFAAMDYGFDRLAVLLLSEDDRGRVTVLDELCASGLTLGEAAIRSASFCRGAEYIAASPDLWNRRQDSGRSGVAIMQAAAVLPPLIRADDRRIPGWRVVREYLHGKGGEPYLKVTRRCRELISCMQALQCDKEVPEDASNTPHAVTHAPEALRYALMSRSGVTGGLQDEKHNDFRFAVRSSWE